MIRQPPALKAPARTTGGDERWRVAGLCLALAAITFTVFGQTLHHEFVDFDDNQYVYDNPVVAGGLTLKGIVWAFTRFHADNWHPLTWLSHMLDCQLYGLHPGGHHQTNVLLHAATVIALFLVLRQMTGALWRSAFVAAVFAIHPLRVESVAWVAERKDVLSGLFFMLTIGAYVRYARRPWSPVRYGLVALLFALGLMCKPMLVTLPLVLLLLDYWPLRRSAERGVRNAESWEGQGKFRPVGWGQLVIEKLPLLALSAATGVAALFAQTSAMPSAESLSLPSRLANALVSGMVYLGQLVWPARLAVYYPYPRHGLPPGEVALAATLLAGLSVAAWGQRRKQPWLLVGWLWYLVMLLPVAGVIQVGNQAHADRYTYLPQIGIYLAVTWLVAEWGAAWWAGRAAIAGLWTAVLAALMICAWQQTAYWKGSKTLWTHALACTTDNEVAHFNLGNTLFQEGRADDAIAEYYNALQISPAYVKIHNNLGLAFLQKGQVDEAIAYFQKALQIKPDFAEACYNLGVALGQKGRADEAIAQYHKALQFKPDYADAHNNLGSALYQAGKVDEAITHYRAALQIKPDFAEAGYNLGVALDQKGSVEEAITQYQRALEANPGYADAHNNLGLALIQKGRVDEAIAQYREALEIRPDFAAAHNNLGTALLQKGRVDEAIAQYQKALEIKPDFAVAHNNLGNALCQAGRVDEAMSHYQRALQAEPDYAEAHNNLGLALFQKGRVDAAIAQYQKALRIKSDDAEAHYNLGNALFRKGSVDDAIAHYQRALEINPGYVEAHNNLGTILSQKGRAGEAMTQFQQVLQIAPTDLNAQNSLAWLLATCAEASLRNGSQAVELAQHANESAGGRSPVILNTLAAALAEAGRFGDAIRTAQKAIELAQAAGQLDLARQLNEELKRYQAGLPLHQ